MLSSDSAYLLFRICALIEFQQIHMVFSRQHSKASEISNKIEFSLPCFFHYHCLSIFLVKSCQPKFILRSKEELEECSCEHFPAVNHSIAWFERFTLYFFHSFSFSLALPHFHIFNVKVPNELTVHFTTNL